MMLVTVQEEGFAKMLFARHFLGVEMVEGRAAVAFRSQMFLRKTFDLHKKQQQIEIK
jgi:hypothetical protein